MKRSRFLTHTGLGVFSALTGSGLIRHRSSTTASESPAKGRSATYNKQGESHELAVKSETADGAGVAGEGRSTSDLIFPNPLKQGDTVAVVATAGIVSDPEILSSMTQVLTAMGLRVRFGDSVQQRHGYLSGTDEERAADLMRMFADPDVKGILAIRGGWGTARMLPYLDMDVIRRNPKVFCGFSDNTTLHLAFLKHAGLVSFHGPNGNAVWSESTRASFTDVLFRHPPDAEKVPLEEVQGRSYSGSHTGKRVEFTSDGGISVLREGASEGPLIGGNLSILTTTMGTSFQPDTRGAILFTEDIGEPPYKIDRMLTHLKHAGLLDELVGFVFGSCLDCDDPESKFSLQEVLEYHLLPLNIPVMLNLDIGHHERNFTLPVGWPVRMDTQTGKLSTLLPQ